MKLKRLIATLATAVMLSGAAIGCTEADQVSSNISKQADNFNVTRKLTVLNARTDTVLLELTGTFALKTIHQMNSKSLLRLPKANIRKIMYI